MKYVPNRTLGASGYVQGPVDRLAIRVEMLHALLLLITTNSEESEPGAGFEAVNVEIQRCVLRLATELASEVHELHEQVVVYGEAK